MNHIQIKSELIEQLIDISIEAGDAILGFYDSEIMEGLYEQHSNYFVVAENIKEAISKAKQKTLFKNKKMHIDGIQELNIIDRFRIKLVLAKSNNDIINYSYDSVKKLL